MGQQQLLLLVLGIVVVAFAIVSGFFIFEENLKKNNAEALITDAINIATAAQAWKVTPAAFGGQRGMSRNDEKDYSGFTFSAISVDEPFITSNGVFTYTADAQGLIITGMNKSHGNKITMTVDGLTADNIIAVVSELDESTGFALQF